MRRAVSSATCSTSVRQARRRFGVARGPGDPLRRAHAGVCLADQRDGDRRPGAGADLDVRQRGVDPADVARSQRRADVRAQGFVETLASSHLLALRLDQVARELDRRARLAVERAPADPPAPHRGDLVALGQVDQRGHPQVGAHALRAAHRPGDEAPRGLTLGPGEAGRVVMDEPREGLVVRRVARAEQPDRRVDPRQVERPIAKGRDQRHFAVAGGRDPERERARAGAGPGEAVGRVRRRRPRRRGVIQRVERLVEGVERRRQGAVEVLGVQTLAVQTAEDERREGRLLAGEVAQASDEHASIGRRELGVGRAPEVARQGVHADTGGLRRDRVDAETVAETLGAVDRLEEHRDDRLAVLARAGDLEADPGRGRRRFGGDDQQDVGSLDLRLKRRAQRGAQPQFALVDPRRDAVCREPPDDAAGEALVAMGVAEEDARRRRLSHGPS